MSKEWETFRRKIKDRRYHWLDKYKLAKGCQVCGWTPDEEYIELFSELGRVGCCMSWDHKDQLTKLPETQGGIGGSGAGMKVLIGKVSKKPHEMRQKRRSLFDEIRKCRVVCNCCHSIISLSQSYKSQEMYELRTGEKWTNVTQKVKVNHSDQIKPSSTLLNFIT